MLRHRVGHLIMAMALAIGCGGSAQAEDLLRLPDGEVTRSGGMVAYLVDPTTRYGHGVLGDAIEAGGFVVERDRQRLLFRLGPDAVFEDRRVRLADLDGDGQPEAILVRPISIAAPPSQPTGSAGTRSSPSPRARPSVSATAGSTRSASRISPARGRPCSQPWSRRM